MNPRFQVAARAALVVSVCVGLGACSRQSQHAHANARPLPVKVRKVEQIGDAALARYSGTLEPAARVDMAFRVGGYIAALGEFTEPSGKSRPLDKGDFVTKGSVLLRIRSADYAQKVATARAAIGEARSDSKLAEAELGRARKLFESKAITKAEFDAKVARADYAKAAVDGALARSGEASVALDDTVLRAPMDGVILSRDVEVGSLVAPGQPVISVADTRTLKAVFAVPQALVEKLQVGSPLQVFVGAESEAAGSGAGRDTKVTRIAPAADTKGRVFSVEAALANASGSLRAGSVVAVRVPEATLAAASLAVPLSAVVRSPGDARAFSVFVLDGDAARAKAHLQPVSLSEVLGNSVTVSGGLRLGQRVVTVGSNLLRDGSEAVVIP